MENALFCRLPEQCKCFEGIGEGLVALLIDFHD